MHEFSPCHSYNQCRELTFAYALLKFQNSYFAKLNRVQNSAGTRFEEMLLQCGGMYPRVWHNGASGTQNLILKRALNSSDSRTPQKWYVEWHSSFRKPRLFLSVTYLSGICFKKQIIRARAILSACLEQIYCKKAGRCCEQCSVANWLEKSYRY